VRVSQEKTSAGSAFIKWTALMLGFVALSGLGIAIQLILHNALWIEVLGFLPNIGVFYCLVRAALAFRPMAHDLRAQRLTDRP
jgi:hypothetical protein